MQGATNPLLPHPLLYSYQFSTTPKDKEECNNNRLTDRIQQGILKTSILY